MVTPVAVATVSTQCVSVHIILKAKTVSSAYHCTMISHGDTEKPTTLILAKCVTAMAMQHPATTMPVMTHSQTVTIKEKAEYVKTVNVTLVSKLLA